MQSIFQWKVRFMIKNRAGYYKKNLTGDMEYYSFVPSALPPTPALNIDDEMIKLLTKANRSIAILDSLSSNIPDRDLFISMYVRKEALLSSQIEGTQATLEDIFDPMLDVNANRDVVDVINYLSATLYAIDRLKTLPLCNRLIRESHEVLMSNVRGQFKNPGEFRKSQNWIGGQGSTIKTARYIPPTVQDMINAMTDLEKFMNEDDCMDILLKVALIHYQFETIHPFLDGNGRIGRLLITLFLLDKKFISTPVFYISYFLKMNRIEYYDRMSEVRRKGNYEQWVNFFLTAVDESAQDAIQTINELSALHNENKTSIEKLGRIKSNVLLFEYLEKNPIIEIGKTAKALNLSFNTVSSAVKRLVNLGILAQMENFSRNRIFVYSDYLKILKRGT